MQIPTAQPGKTRIGWIGTGVMGGMISATILAIFFVPVFYVFVMRVFGRKSLERREAGIAEGNRDAVLATSET